MNEEQNQVSEKKPALKALISKYRRIVKGPVEKKAKRRIFLGTNSRVKPKAE